MKHDIKCAPSITNCSLDRVRERKAEEEEEEEGPACLVMGLVTITIYPAIGWDRTVALICPHNYH